MRHRGREAQREGGTEGGGRETQREEGEGEMKKRVGYILLGGCNQ